MGLSGCYSLLKYLVLLVNLIFWVSSILSYVFTPICTLLGCGRKQQCVRLQIKYSWALPKDAGAYCQVRIDQNRIKKGRRRLNQ